MRTEKDTNAYLLMPKLQHSKNASNPGCDNLHKILHWQKQLPRSHSIFPPAQQAYVDINATRVWNKCLDIEPHGTFICSKRVSQKWASPSSVLPATA